MASSYPRAVILVPVMVFALGTTACSGTRPAPVASSSPATAVTYGPDVISFEGVRTIRFGQTRDALSETPGLDEGPGGCGLHLIGLAEVSPVFTDEAAGEKLVVLWANPPVHTPENIAIGSPVAAVKAAYPQAQPLVAPTGTFQFEGLLVTHGDLGYLFLHDGKVVQKLIAGYVTYLRQLFTDGFGTC